MAKTDWQYHIDNYLENYASSMTLAQYAVTNGLNANTARREMKPSINVALASANPTDKHTTRAKSPVNSKSTAEPETSIKVGKVLKREVRSMSAKQKAARKSDQNGPVDQNFDQHSGGKGVDQNGGDQTKPNGRKQRETVPHKATGGKGRGKAGGSTHADHSSGTADQNFREHCPTRLEIETRANLYGDFGGAHTMEFGGYCAMLEMDADIVALAMATGENNRDLVLAQGRYMTMYRKQNQILKQIAEDYEREPWVDDEGLPMPRDQVEAQAIFGTSQRMTELEAAIARHKLGLLKFELDRQKQVLEVRKQALAEWNRHPMPLAQRIARARELMAQRDTEDLTALETARLFDAEGLDYPPSLQAEVLKEVTWIEPKGESAGGVTDEELEAESRAFMEHRTNIRDNWLPARNEAIEQLIAAETAHQAGELLNEGDFASTEDGVLVDDDGTWTPDNALPDIDDDEDDQDAEPLESW